MIYLDNAATSFPKPTRVYETLRQYLEELGGCPGRGSHEMARQASAVVEETRRYLAELFHIADATRVVLTLNATDALNMAIKGAVTHGDHVVTTILEHNSVARPLNRLERQGVIRVTRVGVSADGVLDPEDVRRALTPQTKLVAIIHGSNVLGSLQPIAEIGAIVREHGAWLLVDASQTSGAVPLDVDTAHIDLLAFPGHKALMGPPGTGGLYIGPRVQLSPWREGGTGLFSELPLQPETFPYAFEAGSPNTFGLGGLRESVQFILQYGVDHIRAHELSLMVRLLEGLARDGRITVYGPRALEQRVAVVSIRIEGCSPAQVGEFLNREHQIAIRTGLHCAPGAHRAVGTFPEGTIRISPGYFTTSADIDRCLEALSDAATQLSEAPRAARAYVPTCGGLTHDQRDETLLWDRYDGRSAALRP